MDDVEVKRSGSRTPLIVAACALMFGLFMPPPSPPPSPRPPPPDADLGRRLEDKKKAYASAAQLT